MSQIDVRIGQEWYFYAQSTSYVVYRIQINQYQYKDGEVLSSDTLIYLRGTNNTVLMKHPEELNENNCKLIKDNNVKISIDINVLPVQQKHRLETIE